MHSSYASLINFYPPPPPQPHLSYNYFNYADLPSHPCFSPQLAGLIFAVCASRPAMWQKTVLALHSVQYTPRRILLQSLTVEGNEKGGGVREASKCRRWFRTVAIDVSLIFNFVVFFSSTYFRFRFAKPS
jgi:hypothetical protein